MNVRPPTFATSLLLALVLFVISPTAPAAEFFVATNGSNSNPGTAALPWRTLQYAADEIVPGSRVTVRLGNYAGFELTTDGTSAAPIEFFAEPGVHITSAVPSRGDGINLEGASYITIDGFNVANMPRAGVRSVGFEDEFASHVTIRNVTAANNGVWGIFTGHVDDLLIENNRTSGSFEEHGIYVSNSGDRPVIRNNVIWDNHGNGIHMNGDESQGGDGVISDAHVYGNVIYNNALPNELGLGGGSGINMDGVQSSRIENNLLYNNHASGISLYRIDGGEPSTDNVVVNNTIHHAVDGRWALNIRDGSTGNAVRNNILFTDHPSRGVIDITANSLTGFTSDYNIIGPPDDDGLGPPFNHAGTFRTLTSWRAQTGNDTHTVIADFDDLFVDFAAGNYELLSTAIARDTGTLQFAPSFDLTGKPRPIGSGIDIGAYEFGLATLAGDYNNDGTVDALDYTVWRNTFGDEGENLAADGDGSGEVDAGDYLVWKERYGATAPGGGGIVPLAAAPEPTALTSALLAITVAFGLRPRAVYSSRSARGNSIQ
jgi:hypothetical protein